MEPLVAVSLFSAFDADVFGDSAFLYYVPIGSGTIQQNGKTEVLHSSDLLVINPMEHHHMTLNEGMLVEIRIPSALLNLGMPKDSRRYIQCSSLQEQTVAMDHLRQMIIGMLDEDLESEVAWFRMQRLSCELVEYLFRYFAMNTRYDSPVQSRKEQWIQYLKVNYKNEITLDEISSHFGLSAPYFSKIFKEETGLPFLKYLARFRCEMSLPMLVHSQSSILHIALEHGFPNVNAYIHTFKEVYQETPAKYRKAHQPVVQEQKISLRQAQQMLEKEKKTQKSVAKVICCQLTGEEPLLDPYWFSLINIGSVPSLMQSDQLRMLEHMLDDLPFRKARVVLGIPDTSNGDSFYEEERILDLLADRKIIPWLVLNYREILAAADRREKEHSAEHPSATAVKGNAGMDVDPTQDTGIRSPGNRSRASFDFLFAYLKSFLRYCSNRFGRDNLRSWTFELYYNSDFLEAESRDYDWMCTQINALLKEEGIQAIVAGPGLQLEYAAGNLERFLAQNTQINHLCISLSAISFDQKDGEVFMNRKTSIDSFLDDYRKAKQLAAAYGIEKVTPVHWMDSIFDQDILNDTCYRGSRLIQAYFTGYGQLPALPISIPDDLSSSRKGFFQGDPGLFTSRNIPKPAYHAFSFLKSLDEKIVYWDDHVLITCSTPHYLQIILHHCESLSYQYYLDEGRQNPEALSSYFEHAQPITLQLRLEGMENARYVLKEKKVGVEEGNAYSKWRRMKFPNASFVGRREIAYLQAAAVPPVTGSTLVAQNHCLELECVLQSNEIRHLHIIYEGPLES